MLVEPVAQLAESLLFVAKIFPFASAQAAADWMAAELLESRVNAYHPVPSAALIAARSVAMPGSVEVSAKARIVAEDPRLKSTRWLAVCVRVRICVACVAVQPGILRAVTAVLTVATSVEPVPVEATETRCATPSEPVRVNV